ncbi:hypothetical protein DsansV1_C15g0134551 [Dioscorea sansibarensis]
MKTTADTIQHQFRHKISSSSSSCHESSLYISLLCEYQSFNCN